MQETPTIMKAQLFPIFLTNLVCCIVLCMACRREQVQQFSIDLLYSDGTTESYEMVAGSMLLVHEGDLHLVAKAVNGTGDELELEVTRFNVAYDTLKREHTIQKAGVNSNKVAKRRQALLDPSGSVSINLQSIAMIDTGRRPVGACQANCCEATCFSTFCCADQYECKNVPCDCKAPSNCPGQQPGPQASHFFEIFRSGKDLMVFKN